MDFGPDLEDFIRRKREEEDPALAEALAVPADEPDEGPELTDADFAALKPSAPSAAPAAPPSDLSAEYRTASEADAKSAGRATLANLLNRSVDMMRGRPTAPVNLQGGKGSEVANFLMRQKLKGGGAGPLDAAKLDLIRAQIERIKRPTVAKPGEEMADDDLLAEAKNLGIPDSVARLLPKSQLRGIVMSETQRRMAAEARARAEQSPEAKRARALAEEKDRLDREAKRTQIDATKGTAAMRERDNAGAAVMGTDWTLGPRSPLLKDETLKREFIKSSTSAREMRSLAGSLRDMVAQGLGPLSSSEDKTKAASLIARLQLLQKQVDVLGVLSAVDISEFVNPQLRNPTSFDSTWKEWAQLYDPKAQLDQYVASMDNKIRETAAAYDVQPTPTGAFAGINKKGKAAGGVRTFKRIDGKLVEVE
jgi:hypothetical protein